MHITKNSSYNLRFCSGEEETPMAFDAMGFAQEFGAQVRAVRKYEKITQMELAWMVGSPKSSALSWPLLTPSPNPSRTLR